MTGRVLSIFWSSALVLQRTHASSPNCITSRLRYFSLTRQVETEKPVKSGRNPLSTAPRANLQSFDDERLVCCLHQTWVCCPSASNSAHFGLPARMSESSGAGSARCNHILVRCARQKATFEAGVPFQKYLSIPPPRDSSYGWVKLNAMRFLDSNGTGGMIKNGFKLEMPTVTF